MYQLGEKFIMAKFKIAINMEFVRSSDKSFEAGVQIASDLGYKYIEPMVHTGWELLSEVNYFHSYSMENDNLLMKEICDKYGVKVASLSAHSPLMKPEAAIPRLTRAIELADACGARFVNSDEMIKPEWMNDDFAHEVMKYTLLRASQVAARHKVMICIEPHGTYTKTAKGLLKIVNLVKSPGYTSIGIPATPISQGWKIPIRALKPCATMCITSTPKIFP